jgi:hypothetical protein
MKNKIVYYALGAVALYYLYDWYKNKMPMQTPIAPGEKVEVLQKETYSLMPSSPIQTDLAPGLSIVSDLINVATPTAAIKEVPTYQTFYGESINGVKVGKVPMTC